MTISVQDGSPRERMRKRNRAMAQRALIERNILEFWEDVNVVAGTDL
jgi:hypothetical protein